MQKAKSLARSKRGAGFTLVGICIVVGSQFFVSTARADSKQECSDAYEKTQVMRDADKIDEGIEQAQVCARDVCAKFVRDDCSKWKAELEARVASIIVEAVDASGAPVTEGSVTLDGVPWLDQLGGTAHAVSKGAHILEINVKGAVPHKQSITIQEGEKNRKITITMVAKAASDKEPVSGVHRIAPWVVGSFGVAALIGGAVTGGLVVEAYSVVQDECFDDTETCTPDGFDAQSRGHLLGPLTTGLLVGGGVLVAAGIIWLVVARRAEEPAATSFFIGPVLTAQQQGLVLGGSW